MDEDGLSLKILIARLVCWSLVGFDILLGGMSLLSPKTVMKGFQPSAEPQGTPLLRRAASIWLFFVPVQIWAAIKTDDPTALRAVSILRLQEVPADPIWLATGEHFGLFGKFGLVFAPLFNLVVGVFLWMLAREIDNSYMKPDQRCP